MGTDYYMTDEQIQILIAQTQGTIMGLLCLAPDTPHAHLVMEGILKSFDAISGHIRETERIDTKGRTEAYGEGYAACQADHGDCGGG